MAARAAGSGVAARAAGSGVAARAAGSGGSRAEGKGPVEKTTHRGIRWQRAPSGRMRWWNEDDGAWVRYHAGDDAPPRPPGWEDPTAPTRAEPTPLPRAKWRSPYRIVPVVFVVFVVAIGLWQALGSGHSGSAETKQAEALNGKCLKQTGVNKQGPVYSNTPVACSSPQAAVRVVAVLPAVAAGEPRRRARRTARQWSCWPGSAIRTSSA